MKIEFKIQDLRITAGRDILMAPRRAGTDGATFAPNRALPGWCLAVVMVLLCAFTVHAQSFSIDRYRISGGGGSSTGGVFSVSGTIGQTDANLAMVGGNYAVTGGFWSIIAVVQTVGSPTLLLSRTNGTATISWDISTTGFTLQETGSFGTQSTSPVWSNSTGVVNNSLTVPISGNKYYRLKKP